MLYGVPASAAEIVGVFRAAWKKRDTDAMELEQKYEALKQEHEELRTKYEAIAKELEAEKARAEKNHGIVAVQSTPEYES